MLKNRSYTPAEVGDMFGISKSTLLRWENEGAIPPIERDDRNQNRRMYSLSHLKAISEMVKRRLRSQYRWAAGAGDQAGLEHIHESLSLMKFMAGDRLGLHELKEIPSLRPFTISQLLRSALEDYGPDDESFVLIIDIIHKQVHRARTQ
jgi:DNA-binding transcriptional MerR regulator